MIQLEIVETSSQSKQCSQQLNSICSLTNPTLQDTFLCLQAHINELEGSCSIPLNSMLANIYNDCETDISFYCHSDYVASCLQDNYEKLSTECQTQVLFLFYSFMIYLFNYLFFTFKIVYKLFTRKLSLSWWK